MRGGYPSKLQRSVVGGASEGSACLRDLPTPAKAGASRRREPLRRRQARRSMWRSHGLLTRGAPPTGSGVLSQVKQDPLSDRLVLLQ
jgi:hypothetical protein